MLNVSFHIGYLFPNINLNFNCVNHLHRNMHSLDQIRFTSFNLEVYFVLSSPSLPLPFSIVYILL